MAAPKGEGTRIRIEVRERKVLKKKKIKLTKSISFFQLLTESQKLKSLLTEFCGRQNEE